MLKFNVLQYKNDWESDVYSVNGQQLQDLSKVAINGKEYDVVSKSVRKFYSDMGKQYVAESVHYFVTEKVFGMVMRFDLNKIVNSVEVLAIDFV